MSSVLTSIIYVLSAILRILGLGVLGASLGWLVLDLLRTGSWQVQIAAFLGLLGLVVAIAFVGAAALGALAIGIAVAIFIWGMPRKHKEAEAEK